MEPSLHNRQADKLVFLGILLFLAGLLEGFCIPLMANPRMALSAHLEAVMNGMFLVLLGLIWRRLLLSDRLFSVAFWLVVYGSFANFSAVLLGALTGSGKLMPLAGGTEGQGIAEPIISFLLVSLGFCMVAVCSIDLWGLYRHMQSPNRT